MARISVSHFLLVAALIGSLFGNAIVEASEDEGPGTSGFVSASNGLPMIETHFAVW